MTCPTCGHAEHVSGRCDDAVADMRGEIIRCDCRTGFIRPTIVSGSNEPDPDKTLADWQREADAGGDDE